MDKYTVWMIWAMGLASQRKCDVRRKLYECKTIWEKKEEIRAFKTEMVVWAKIQLHINLQRISRWATRLRPWTKCRFCGHFNPIQYGYEEGPRCKSWQNNSAPLSRNIWQSHTIQHRKMVINKGLRGMMLSLSIQAAVTEYHSLRGLHNRHLFLTVLEAGKSQVKVPANLCVSKALLPSLQVTIFFLYL